jgi:hypothetical protein
MPMTLDDFKRYTLRALGAPIIEINVTDEQLQDRYEDARRKYHDHHYDGTERIYFKHQITQTDYDQKFIALPDNIVGVNKIIKFTLGAGASGDSTLFNISYQFLLNEMHLLWSAGNIAYYEHTMQHLTMMDQILNGVPTIRFNRAVNKLHVDINWDKGLEVGKWVVLECYVSVDPEVYPRVFEDIWFKNYYKALVKRQWGENLSKFAGVQMIGGVTLNGPAMYQDANEEVMRLEQELRDSFETPIDAIYLG